MRWITTLHNPGQHTGIFIDDDPDPVCEVVKIKLGRDLRLRLQGATLRLASNRTCKPGLKVHTLLPVSTKRPRVKRRRRTESKHILWHDCRPGPAVVVGEGVQT
jgi:hypothetical protein